MQYDQQKSCSMQERETKGGFVYAGYGQLAYIGRLVLGGGAGLASADHRTGLQDIIGEDERCYSSRSSAAHVQVRNIRTKVQLKSHLCNVAA